MAKIAAQQKEIEDLRAGRLGPYVQALQPHTELEKLPLHTLKALQSQLRQDLDTIDKVSDLEFNHYLFMTSVMPWCHIL